MQFFTVCILSHKVRTAAHHEANAKNNYNLKVVVAVLKKKKIRQTFTQLIQEISLL